MITFIFSCLQCHIVSWRTVNEDCCLKRTFLTLKCTDHFFYEHKEGKKCYA